VIHETPGLDPGAIGFARRLIAAGYTVYLPSLFGRPATPATGREIVRSILRVCVAREFTKLADRTSPVVGWLRALAVLPLVPRPRPPGHDRVRAIAVGPRPRDGPGPG
jgi:dienelactone hydrolase